MTSARAPLGHPPSARLRKPGEFSEVKRTGRRVASRCFHCEYRLRDVSDAATGAARLGMAVSRRVSKLAVERNRIRRQIRESFRLARPRLPSIDVLVTARGDATRCDNRALRDDLSLLWHKLGMATSVAAPLNAGEAPGTMRGPAAS